MSKKLGGIIPALITPFKENGQIDFDAYSVIVEEMSEAGVHGFFTSGTTGEGPYHLTKEKVMLAKAAKEISNGRQYICTAVIQPSTFQVLKELEEIAKIKPDYLVVVPPFYFKHDQATILEHYKEITANTDIPIIAYDIPQHTLSEIEYETRMELINMSGIVGLKDSKGEFSQFAKGLIDANDGDFKWIQGWDNLYAPSALLGSHGYVSGLSHLQPETFVTMNRAAQEGDSATVIMMQKKINLLFEIITVANGKVIPSIKYALFLQNKCAPYLRQIKTPLTIVEKESINKKMVELNLIQ